MLQSIAVRRDRVVNGAAGRWYRWVIMMAVRFLTSLKKILQQKMG